MMAIGKHSSSFLLRVWRESGAGDDVRGGLRGYLRNLRTGEELYARNPSALAEAVRILVEAELDSDQLPENEEQESKYDTA